MSKSIRLNQTMRGELFEFAKANVPVKKESAACDKAYDAVVKTFKKILDKRYNPEDMKVLERYNCTSTRNAALFVNLDSSLHFEFKFRPDDHFKTPASENYLMRKRLFTFESNKAFEKQVETYNKLKDDLKKKREDYVVDYKALIDSCRTTNQILEAWPAAHKILDPYVDVASRNLPTTVTTDALDRIKKTNLGA